ncbi:MAG: hypothetical protein ACK4JY_10005 [Brevundimonas sp.]|uniref:hypothetical protein n=1 Tax=Brevundimonas sp. TaxID=1871086 RepID=UPI00391B3CE9
MTEPHDPAPAPPASAARPAALNDLSEDALGFGARELVTMRDLLLRPRHVLEAWMTAGPSGGGHYARPLRLYLGLNAILMLILFLRGGTTLMLAGVPDLYLQPLIEASGKSRDGFLADADGWMTLVLVPLVSVAYACVAAPLLRWWDPETLGWRRGFRAAFAYLCAWTVPILPFAWWSFSTDPVGQALGLALILVGIVTFLRMGAGRWWRAPAAGFGKAVALSIALWFAGTVGLLPVLAIGLLAGRFG